MSDNLPRHCFFTLSGIDRTTRLDDLMIPAGKYILLVRPSGYLLCGIGEDDHVYPADRRKVRLSGLSAFYDQISAIAGIENPVENNGD